MALFLPCGQIIHLVLQGLFKILNAHRFINRVASIIKPYGTPNFPLLLFIPLLSSVNPILQNSLCFSAELSCNYLIKNIVIDHTRSISRNSIMRISLIVMLGASLFSAACSAEELCTDGVCVSDAGLEDARTMEVNSNGDTTSSENFNPQEQAQAILNRMKKRSSKRKQNNENNSKKPNDVQANKKTNNKKIEVTPEMERYFQDLIDSGGDHARLSVLSDLLSGTKTSTPVKDMPTIILTDKETADEHLRQSWGASNEEQMKRDRKEEVDSLDRLQSIFMESLSSADDDGKVILTRGLEDQDKYQQHLDGLHPKL